MSKMLPNGLRRFLSKSEGSGTVKSVLWLPIFFLLFGMMTDVSMIFNRQSRVLRVVQDANRNLSVGRLDTEAETEAWVASELVGLSPNVIVDTQIVAGVATTTATVPAVDLEVLGLFSALNNLNVSVTSQHFIEF